ncbi:RBBP9/YdeN family alpha/beta hydrolase [Rhodococcus aetherivorans]|uniref:RBBP9/YdeN family alpha/beta hydrolase n=1 Tax=Rhodococcus aetherivorans TaxID=191292 RepID=UPI00163AA75F|nr:alpha/beta hydrolase [Rhodococcus aetherivorans]MBC2589813.1 serine hydrolase family protein [Rhodococcus aetherivorans]
MNTTSTTTITPPTVVLVPGFVPLTADHWQCLLAEKWEKARIVAPPGCAPLSRTAWVEALEAVLAGIAGPVVLVAHGAGVLTTVHWARQPNRPVDGALLVAPPDFELPLPDGYPSTEDLDRHGWNPLPRRRLPFRSIVAASRNDALACFRRVAGMAEHWGSRLIDAGDAGHLDPTAGYGNWDQAHELVRDLGRVRIPGGVPGAPILAMSDPS